MNDFNLIHRFASQSPRSRAARAGVLQSVSALGFAAASLALGVSGSAPAHAATPVLSTLHIFNANSEGAQADATPVLQSNGQYLLPLSMSGMEGSGSLVAVSTAGSVSVLHSNIDPDTTNDGATPSQPLLLASDGNYYGTTMYGGTAASNGNGSQGYGTAFMMTPAGVVTVLHSFNDGSVTNDGMYPTSTLVEGSDGNLYGTTSYGGAGMFGTIFQMTKAGVVTIMHSFDDGSADENGNTDDGYLPECGLTIGSDGTLYGVATQSSDNIGQGIAFNIDLSGDYTILHEFGDGTVANDGQTPVSALLLGADNSLYGTTAYGGSTTGIDSDGHGFGTLFKMDNAGDETVLHSFDDGTVTNDGQNSLSSLSQASGGTLYGTCYYGGSTGTYSSTNSADGTGYGTLFSYLPSSGAYTSLASFGTDSTANPGINPKSPPAISSDGERLYGVTSSDLSSGSGAFYEYNFDPSTTPPPAHTRFDFNQDGYADIVWYNTQSGGVSVWDINDDAVTNFGGTFTQLAPSSGWEPMATPDINGDNYPDLLWWNNQTGELSLWTLQGTTVTNYGGDFAQIKDTNWRPVAVADDTGTTGGTTWTLVFQNTATGDISRWLMNGSTVAQYGGTIYSLGAGSPWTVVGAPDLDGDGKSDLLFWNSSTGEVSYWSCDLANSKVLAFHGDFSQVSDTTWHLMGSEDFNGDGHPDLLWWNSTSGSLSRWLLNGTSVTNYGGNIYSVTPSSGWIPQGAR